MSDIHKTQSYIIPDEQINVPKQLPRYGINILQAVATGNSTDINVLMMTSSMDIIRAADHKQYIPKSNQLNT